MHILKPTVTGYLNLTAHIDCISSYDYIYFTKVTISNMVDNLCPIIGRWICLAKGVASSGRTVGRPKLQLRGVQLWLVFFVSTNNTCVVHRHFDCWLRVLTNLAKWNSLCFPCFPDPLNSLFHTITKLKTDVTNYLSNHFGTFVAKYILNSMVTGYTLASQCSPNQSMQLLSTIMHTISPPKIIMSTKIQ